MKDYSRAIRANRFHDFSLKCNVPDPGAKITIRQLRHKFLFGSNIFGLVDREGEDQAAYGAKVLELWNTGTLPFYWGRYEPQEGKPDPGDRVYNAALWAKEKGLRPKGHPLCWHTMCADWLLKYDNDTILKMQLDRIRREVDRYKGTIDMWDVINELVIMPVFSKYDNAVTRIANHIGPLQLALECFKTVREVNPQAFLLINDFDLSPGYEKIIEKLLDKGCSIDAIGLQTHQHEGYRGSEEFADYLDRFSRFGLPLHFTENTIISGEIAPKVDDLNDIHRPQWPSTEEGEALQKEQVEEFYSQLYAHPSVEAIVWWDLEDGAWLNAPAGLVRRDLSSKPAFTRLKELIKGEWRFKESGFTPNAEGRLRINAPEGDYEAVINGKPFPFSLDKERSELRIG